ncbi:dTDP-4-dehydrorhamnose reductase [Rhodococcus coprophilus]|uniref:dTDP-4-dehydrorhamnose reductase n=1 Tax=Rhodococcus coprophilus TaxID=38310 RepID=A0A2X4UZ22_9NOCA|nr:dTDP-4-dehydrorhamnose reductase [Rhodococcus coprophilus]MBM7460098.1 dTDP-4-dehydrorhamnose reductase [Rhodococcus coprophilus]SQI38280.1 dTDP-6-deoxy-L-lyxo-4-hexulose reductase [Rhodococcus coprophilus]
MPSLLVTGSHGQLGSALVARAAAAGVPIRGVGSTDLDITDPAAAAAAIEPGAVVINCAAYTAVDAAETDEDRAAVVNGTGPGVLAAACADKDARLIHISTDYVFAGDASQPYGVDAATGPRTAYGRTKLAGEQAVLSALPSAHVVRTAWVYTGEGTDFVATMRRLERERDTLRVVDDQRGSPTYAYDLADALLELAGRTDLPGGVLHATNAGDATWFDLARAVFEEVGADPARVQPCGSDEFVRPAPRPAYSVLAGDAWVSAGLTPLRPWREALHAAVEALATRG